MSCSVHIYEIKTVPEWESLVACKNCEGQPSKHICEDDEHAFIQLFPTIANDHYPYAVCQKCGHTGGEILDLGGKVNPNSNIWGIRKK